MSDEANKEAMVANFVSITGSDVDRAKFMLDATNYHLELALENHFQELTEESTVNIAAPSNDSDEDDDDKAYYVGGSERSGQAVLPNTSSKSKPPLDELFDAAKSAGAEIVDLREEAAASKKPNYFRGTGYTLGDDSAAPSKKLDDEASATAAQQPARFVITLYSNGFCVDDEELQPYDSPEGKMFLTSVSQNKVPRELLIKAKGKKVEVDIKDNRENDYVAPPKKLKPFGGAGNRLGSASPSVVTPASASQSTPTPVAANPIQLNESQPITRLSIRLPSGQLSGRFNHSHTLADVRSFIRQQRAEFASTPFQLLSGFPPKPLPSEGSDGVSLESLNLINSVINLRP